MPIKILHLAVKTEYFNQIKKGDKNEEYRLTSEYWRKRLVNKTFDEIHITLGYPSKSEHNKRIIKRWNGFKVKTIKHNHFGEFPVDVYAIDLSVD